MTGEKILVSEKLKFLLKEFQYVKSVMLHQIFNEFTLHAMLVYQLDLLP